MAENDHKADGSDESELREPQFANPLKRLALPGLLILALGLAVAWGIVTFFQDASRARENYRSLVRPPITFKTPTNMPPP